MSTTTDLEYAKYSAAHRADLDRINFDGVDFLKNPVPESAKTLVRVVSAPFKFAATLLVDCLNAQNERNRKFPYSPPPVRGLW